MYDYIIERRIIMFHQRGPRYPMGPMNNMRNFSPYQPFGRIQVPNRGAGGLLSKLLSKPGAINSFGSQPLQKGAGGFLSNLLSNPSSAGGMLNNIQRAVNVANQVGPMVQQYGPMVRNIPSLIKLYKELKTSDDDPNEDDTEAKDIPISSTPEKKIVIKTGTTTPKLYI
jgi:hypothetical protein